MTDRITLPQQRARETRHRILDAASRVFARRGYSQATVEDIAAEAGVSNGALYHHFESKEELFRALLDDHLSGELSEFGAMRPAASLREMIEHFVAFQRDHLQSHRELGPVSMEFWAVAAGEDWARDPVAEFHRRARDVIAEVLRVGQSAGVVRSDLDAEAAALLLLAVFEGVGILQALDPEGVNLQELSQPWADLIERFTKGGGEADMRGLQEGMAALFQQFSQDQTASATDA